METEEWRMDNNGERRREEFLTLGKVLPTRTIKTQTERRRTNSTLREAAVADVKWLTIDESTRRGKNAKRWERWWGLNMETRIEVE